MIRTRTDPWWEVRAETLNAWIQDALPADRSGFVLKTDLYDEACGPYNHAGAANAVGELLGMDHDLEVVRSSRAQLMQQATSASFIVCDVRALPFRPESIPVVLSLSTLDHFDKVEDIRTSIDEISRVMKRGGLLLLTLDNPRNPSNALRAALPQGVTGKLRADVFPLGVTLNQTDAVELFRAAGFEIRESTYLIHSFRYITIRMLDYLQRHGYEGLLRLGIVVTHTFEILQSLPTRAFSGHYAAWLLEKC